MNIFVDKDFNYANIELVHITEPRGRIKMEKVFYDYSLLRKRIKEKYVNQREFAQKMNMSHVTLSAKLNNKVNWSQSEMIKACDLLDQSDKNILLYFFVK